MDEKAVLEGVKAWAVRMIKQAPACRMTGVERTVVFIRHSCAVG